MVLVAAVKRYKLATCFVVVALWRNDTLVEGLQCRRKFLCGMRPFPEVGVCFWRNWLMLRATRCRCCESRSSGTHFAGGISPLAQRSAE